MWPFDQLRRRQYEKAYDAAIAVFVGAYLPGCLTAEERTSVELMVDKMIQQEKTFPPSAHRRWASWEGRGAYRVVAMARVNSPLPKNLGTWKTLLGRWSAGGVMAWFEIGRAHV